MMKQKIMTIDAKNLFDYFAKNEDKKDLPFCFNTLKRTFFRKVVKQESVMDECPLFYQFLEVLKEENAFENSDFENNRNLLYDKLIIVDFDDIFLFDETGLYKDNIRIKKETQLENAKDIIENGFVLHFDDYDVHMRPFDKSGNMSRNGRITFIDEKYITRLNERLNLGIDFSKLPVVLSKYYAYRGLYLSTSRRIEHKSFHITPETLVIMKDQRMKLGMRGAEKGKEKPVDGYKYERNVYIETAERGEEDGEWTFLAPELRGLEYTDVPYDGEGLVTPLFSKYINEVLQTKEATSYQIRLPFVKGMVHEVDVMSFLEEFTSDGIGEGEYWYEDAFGINRDLKKASILITESMFKGKGWLLEYCNRKAIEEPENEYYKDPMVYYCNMLNKYHHALYVSGTNLPYGRSQYTHLTYQVINTLDFTEEQFKRVVDGHCTFLQQPIEFLRGWDGLEHEENSIEEDGELTYYTPNWQRAVLENNNWSQDTYIKEQLNNIQKGLLTKIATGKILVQGQTRYLCRDLLPLLACLLKNLEDISNFYRRYLYQRFYMPLGKDKKTSETMKLDYGKYYAFFRSPHLSRNEQCILQPLASTTKDAYVRIGKDYEKYVEHLNLYHKYFAHLIGVIMVPRGSIVPLCLGGADFDGDLVSVVYNQDVVDAVKKGAYRQRGINWWERSLPVVKIPNTRGESDCVPEYVPYLHVFSTFSNRIGQISNASISIGQKEYDRIMISETKFDAETPTCAKCTLLTGLEIDAAKNGMHPNLDLILKGHSVTCSYLAFLKKFKKLKSEMSFSVDNIVIKEESTIKEKCIEVTARNCKTTAKFYIPKGGTFINELPILFFEYYNKRKQSKKEKIKVDGIVVDYYEDISSVKEEIIAEFRRQCKAIFDLHFFYKKLFLKNLSKEKNKGNFAPENMEKLIEYIYDKEHSEEILRSVLPALKVKLEESILTDTAIGEIKDRINRFQWLFQAPENRVSVLEKIIGNDFKVSNLTEEEKNLLCSFSFKGYKILWLLVGMVRDARIPSFDDMKKRNACTKSKYFSEELKYLDALLEQEAQQYYDNNASDIGDKIYTHCLDELKKMIGIYSHRLDVSTMMVALYKEAEIHANSDNNMFFWDAFNWEDLKTFVERG